MWFDSQTEPSSMEFMVAEQLCQDPETVYYGEEEEMVDPMVDETDPATVTEGDSGADEEAEETQAEEEMEEEMDDLSPIDMTADENGGMVQDGASPDMDLWWLLIIVIIILIIIVVIVIILKEKKKKDDTKEKREDAYKVEESDDQKKEMQLADQTPKKGHDFE